MPLNPDTADLLATSREEEIRRIPLAAMFTALGVLLPQLFHMLGLGAMFLPMFLPVIAAAMLLPVRLTFTVAFLTPILSWLLTGMPPLSPPVLPILIVELTAAGTLASILRRKFRWKLLWSAAAAMLLDRILLLAILESVFALSGIRHPLLGPAAVAAGLPGVVFLLIVLPPSVRMIETRFPRLSPVAEGRFGT